MPAYLRAADGRAFPVAVPARLGRDPACEIAVNDARVSRVHALVWRDGDALLVRDEGSSNGTYVNEQPLTPGQVYRLRPGDQLRCGGAHFTVEAAAAPLPAPPAPAPLPASHPLPATLGMTLPAAPPPRRSRLPLAALGGCLALILVLVCGGLGALAVARPPVVQTALAQWAPAGSPGPQGTAGPATVPPEAIRLTVLSTSPPPTPFTPAIFVDNQAALLNALARLNQAELDFLQRARAQAGRGASAGVSRPARQFQPITEADFSFIGQNAVEVAVLAQQQGQALAAQGGGNDPAAQSMAQTYAALAGQAAVVALKVDALRQSWVAQQLGLNDVADQLALAAGAVWHAAVNPQAAAGSNPFAAYAADPSAVVQPLPLTPQDFAALLADLNHPANTLGWLAISPAAGDQTVSVPAGDGSFLDLADPAVTQRLLDPNTPLTPGEITQAAGAILRVPGDSASPTTVTVPNVSVVAAQPSLSGQGQTPPSFPGGQVTLLTASNDDPAVSTILSLDGNNAPSIDGQTTVAAQPLVVTLSLSNLAIQSVTRLPKGSSSFEAELLYSFDVQWTTTFAAPQFELDCAGSNHFAVTTVSGSQRVSVKGFLLLYPGAGDAYCYATRNGNTLGGASQRFLVGDAAEATQRANQVETDSAALDLTLTADALGTAGRAQTQAAQTQAVAQTADALSTEQAATRTAEAAATATYLAANADRFATETQRALTSDDDGDGVTNADDRCFDRAETKNGWRDEDGCPDTLPTMNLGAAEFVETLTNGPVNAFSTVADLTVDFAAGLTSGVLTGGTSWDDSYFCYNTNDPSEIFETVSAHYAASYIAEVTGAADGVARTYTAALEAEGVTDISLNQPFTHEACTHLNSANLDDIWSGAGTVSGTWDGNTFGTLATNWDVDDIHIAGTWSGTVTLTEANP